MRKIRCITCSSEHSIDITAEQIAELSKRPRRLIQDICPNLSADERELLISGICGVCYDEMCDELEEEEEKELNLF